MAPGSSKHTVVIRGGHVYESNASSLHEARADAVRRHYGDSAPTGAEYLDVVAFETWLDATGGRKGNDE